MALAPELPDRPLRVRPLHLRPRAGSARRRRAGGRRASTPTPARPRRGRPATAAWSAGRLSRLQASGNVMTGTEQVLIEDWCQQYPSHSIGTVEFGPDGALYASGGDGASFNFVDYGQDGSPLNPCGDPPGGGRRSPDARRPPRAARCAARTCAPRGDPVSLDGSVIRVEPGHRRGAARQPAAPATPTPTPGGSSPTGCATPSASRSARHQRAVGRRRRLERLGGDQPHRQPDRRDGGELRLALLRGRRPPGRLRRRQPQHLREPVRGRPGAVTAPYSRLPPQQPGRPRRDLPDRQLLDRRAGLPVRRIRQHLPGRVRRRALLRRLLPRLHLGHAQGRRRPPRSRPDPHLRGRSGQPGRPGDRARAATSSTPTSTAGRSAASSTPRRTSRPRRSPPPRRPAARRRSRSTSTAPAPATPTATRSPTPGTSTATAPSTTPRRASRPTPTPSRGATPPPSG